MLYIKNYFDVDINGRWPNNLKVMFTSDCFFFFKEMLVSKVQTYKSEHVHIHIKTQLNININGQKNINVNIILYAFARTNKIN